MSRSVANWLLYTPFALVYIFFIRPRVSGGSEPAGWLLDVLGLVLILIGLGIRIVAREWKSSHLPSGLVSSGPYSLVRNPMYVGSFLVGLGMCVIIGSLWFLVAFTIIYAIVHEMVVRQEERYLIKRWPEEYAAYLKDVPAWLPSPGALAKYMRTREPFTSLRIAVVRELNTICGAFMGAAMLKAAKLGSAEAQTFYGLAGLFFLVWLLGLVKPVRLYLRGSAGKSSVTSNQ